MKFLVVGLGSMGTRRVRNLLALGHKSIAGFDVREDRRAEATEKYGITTYDSFEEAQHRFRPDALIISTSPAHHMTYARSSFERGLPCFIEASVVDAEGILQLHERAVHSPVLVAPSCTMRFFPGPRKVKELVKGGIVGRPINLNYQTGQWLPDWHPWEKIEDFYVSKRDTGGCREIVPFELTWLNDVFGDPEPISCVKSKVSDINADIDDIYHFVLRYPGGMLANITIEVLSRPHATREFWLVGTAGEVVFSADENCVRYATVNHPEWVRDKLSGGTVESGYINPEEPYIAELATFIAAVERRDKSIFPNTLLDDYRVLTVLESLEQMNAAAR